MKLTKNFTALAFSAILLGAVACVDESAAPAAEVSDPVEADRSQTTETVQAVQDKSSISFVGRKVTGQHDGGFRNFDAMLGYAGGEPDSIDVSIDMSSIWSDNDRLTNHLKSGDFFLIEQYPNATFESTSIEPSGQGQYEITGNLEMRGQENSITFPASVEMIGDEIHAVSEFTINRQQWGVSYPGMPDDLIKDEVEVTLDLTFPMPGSMEPMGDGMEAMSATETSVE